MMAVFSSVILWNMCSALNVVMGLCVNVNKNSKFKVGEVFKIKKEKKKNYWFILMQLLNIRLLNNRQLQSLPLCTESFQNNNSVQEGRLAPLSGLGQSRHYLVRNYQEFPFL